MLARLQFSVYSKVVQNLTAISKYSSSVSYYINILEYRMELLYNNAWNAYFGLTNQGTINLKRSGEFSLSLFLMEQMAPYISIVLKLVVAT